MTSSILRQINCKNELRSHIGDFIESFVAYYGEEYRDTIEKAFSNVLLVAFTNPASLDILFDKFKEEITMDIAQKYKESFPPNIEIKDLFKDYSFEFIKIMPISKYHSFIESYKENPQDGILPTMFREIEPLLTKINPAITFDNFSQYIDSPELEPLNNILVLVEEMKKEYDERLSKYQYLEDQIELSKNEQKLLGRKYHRQFIKENLDLITPSELEEIKNYLEGNTEFFPFNVFGEHLYGYSINSPCSLDCFSEEAERILQDGEKSTWRKETIIKERIKYFKRAGIDLGNNYESYIQNDDARKRWPSFDRVKRFQESRNKAKNAFNNEFFSNTDSHLAIREEIESLGLVNKDDGFDASIYTRSSSPACVCPNFRKTPSGYELYPVLIAECGQQSGHLDHYLVHELNHVLELHIKAIDQHHYQMICGWDTMDGEILSSPPEVDTINVDRPKRKYELFNEIINEAIAQEVSKLMQDRNIHIFDTKEKSKYKHTTSYERYFFLLDDFFKEFKKDILASRQQGRIDIIWDTVGKENFDELNEVIRAFYERFPNEFALHEMFIAMKNNEENEDTIFAREMNNKKKEVLQKMHIHYMVHKDKIQEAEEQKKSFL